MPIETPKTRSSRKPLALPHKPTNAKAREFIQANTTLRQNNIPLEEAKKFVTSTNDVGKGWSGATMDLKSGKTLEVGVDSGHVVGAEPSSITKDRVATHLYGAGSATPNLSLLQFAQEASRIKKHATSRGATIGTWYDSQEHDKGIQLDAGRVFKSKNAAGRAAIARDETATFDLKKGESIYNHEHRARLGIPGELKQQNKTELRVPQQIVPGSAEFEGR